MYNGRGNRCMGKFYICGQIVKVASSSVTESNNRCHFLEQRKEGKAVEVINTIAHRPMKTEKGQQYERGKIRP